MTKPHFYWYVGLNWRLPRRQGHYVIEQAFIEK